MPGAFAHIAAANLARESRRLDPLGFSKRGAAALNDWFGFTEIGAVSPDYPYLSAENRKEAPRWADLMHYERTGEMLHAGVEGVHALKDEQQRRAFAQSIGETRALRVT